MLAPQGKYLYFLVCNDHSIQYEVEGEKPGGKKVINGHLTRAQFSSLNHLLDSEALKNVQGTLGKERQVRDYSIALEVRIGRNEAVQSFKMMSLPSKDGFGAVPQPVLDLLCWVDDLRKADFRITRNCDGQ
jgi:hypothetical protein